MLRFTPDREKLEVLLDGYTRINSSSTDLNGLLSRIIEAASLLTEGEASSLLLLNEENNRLYFEVALGPKGPSVKRFSLNLGEGIAGWVAEKNASIIANDAQSDPRFRRDIPEEIGYPTSSILAVPMRLKDRCVGVIEILNKRGGRRFTEEDLQWLEVFATQAAIALQNARSYQQVRDELDRLRDRAVADGPWHELVGQSRAITERLAIARKAAEADSSVLLVGESGVGKELFAEQIHLASTRRDGPFLRVNCAALPEGLLESELFGHVRGAFTDAVADRRGRFELADGGTIFLDEIADLPASAQARLLRVIQQRTFERVGSSEPLHSDVRIIAATNRDLDREVAAGRFRADLYYRLAVLPIRIPPLRERREDIPLLAAHFLRRHAAEAKKPARGFTQAAMDAMLSYAWPGNVRELENAVERAVVFSRGELIDAGDLLLSAGAAGGGEGYAGKTLREALAAFRKHFIAGALEANGWHQTRTARALAIQRSYLSKLVKELGIIKQRGD